MYLVDLICDWMGMYNGNVTDCDWMNSVSNCNCYCDLYLNLDLILCIFVVN